MISAKVQVRQRALNDLRAMFRAEFADLPETMARRGAARIKQNIFGQRYPHVALSRSYVGWKKRKGLDPRILIATGKYVASITARKQNATTWLVAPAAGATHKGRALSTIGLWLEYGTRRMPARPHFRVEASRLRQEMAQEGSNRMAKIKRGMLKKETVVVK